MRLTDDWSVGPTEEEIILDEDTLPQTRAETGAEMQSFRTRNGTEPGTGVSTRAETSP